MSDAPRTSATHPLQIAAVAAGSGTGMVGLTFCPGKKQANAFTGAWNRDLDSDVAAIARWGAVVVVSLIETHEFDTLRVTELGETVRRHQMEWLHLPVADVSTPDAGFEKSWREIGPGLRSRLGAGFNILVHCKGGLGRAGMAATRLLVDMGLPPNEALTAVRQARPGAVETKAQERYVLGLKALSPAAVHSASREDRAIGAMVGLAIGDAIGTTLEFSPRDHSPRITDMVGGGPFRLLPGQWTDDTAMALALAESLIADKKLDEADLMARFVRWHRQGAYSCTGRCFDIGTTTRQALARFERTGNPVAGATDPRTAGNGSLMRLAPIAIAAFDDTDLRHDLAARQSRTTHAAPEAVDSCIAYSDLLADAITGRPREDVLKPRHSDMASSVRQILAGSWQGKRRDVIRSSGYVIHSLEAAIWCVARTDSFADAVLLAANLGDDADTTAAITGQLAGALYGYAAIPQAWRGQLAWHDRLVGAARELLA